MKLKFMKTEPVKSPSVATSGSIGIDFYVPDNFGMGLHENTIVDGHCDVLIPLGIKVCIPKGWALVLFNKSGVSTKRKLLVGAQVIDSDYEGVIHAHLINTSNDRTYIHPGEKIVQGILIPHELVEFEEYREENIMYDRVSERGISGFGSSN